MESKKPWLSKTVWVGLITAVAPFVPGMSEWLSANAAVVVSVLGAIGILLRLITKDKISLGD